MKIAELLKSSDKEYRRSLWFFLAAYFLVLVNYPLIRASSTTFFIGSFGARSTPAALLWSVVFLSASILIINKLQARHSVQTVFLWASGFSSLVFLVSSLGLMGGVPYLSYAQFIWKEIYIVIQVHLLLAYANTYFPKEDFKILLGPIGAAGSLGGILGGVLTSSISAKAGTMAVMSLGVALVAMPGFFFLFTSRVMSRAEKNEGLSPLRSISTGRIRNYVFLIAAIVALTQFIINIADFRFHVEFEKAIADASGRTSYLGNIYSLTNLLTLIFQLFLLPYVLPRVSEKNYHLFIPLSYLVCVGSLMLGSQVGLLPVAALYVYFKAADYSLFSAGKEILYQPLERTQKYGAKYLTDMLVYRGAKAMVAAVLIYLQSSTILNMLMVIFLVLWIILVIQLFQLHRKIFI